MSEGYPGTSVEDCDNSLYVIYVGSEELWLTASQAKDVLIENPDANIGGRGMNSTTGSNWEIRPDEKLALTGGVAITITDEEISNLLNSN